MVTGSTIGSRTVNSAARQRRALTNHSAPTQPFTPIWLAMMDSLRGSLYGTLRRIQISSLGQLYAELIQAVIDPDDLGMPGSSVNFPTKTIVARVDPESCI